MRFWRPLALDKFEPELPPSNGKGIEASNQNEEHHFALEAFRRNRMNVFRQQPFNVASGCFDHFAASGL